MVGRRSNSRIGLLFRLPLEQGLGVRGSNGSQIRDLQTIDWPIDFVKHRTTNPCIALSQWRNARAA